MIVRANSTKSTEWNFKFEMGEKTLCAEYLLPEFVAPRRGIRDFFQPICEQVRSGCTPLLDGKSQESAKRAACTLVFLDALRERAEDFVEQQRVMEALVLITTQWKISDSVAGPDLVHISAKRSLEDHLPAIGALATGVLGPILGPLAWMPGVLVINEAMMRRTKKWEGFPEAPPCGFTLAKAVLQHHLVRMFYDPPFLVRLDEWYKVDDHVELSVLQSSIAEGSYSEHVSGQFKFSEDSKEEGQDSK